MTTNRIIVGIFNKFNKNLSNRNYIFKVEFYATNSPYATG